MANKSDTDQIIRGTSGIDVKTLASLVKLSNDKEINNLYEAVRVMKQQMLFDEFSYPAGNPIKNSVNKSFYKGGDYYLTMLVNLVKKSGEILEKLEEKKE